MPETPPQPDWPPDPSQDPRTRIPDVLRRPVEHPDPAPYPKEARALAEVGRAWAVALDFVVTILAGLGLGWLFDWWQNTVPWGVLTGLVLGFITAFIRIVRYTQRQERKEAAERDRRRAAP